tara:strand:+ start:318 stop:566 length:249 start_codon:yes stop_codon:yes gene_type:complete
MMRSGIEEEDDEELVVTTEGLRSEAESSEAESSEAMGSRALDRSEDSLGLSLPTEEASLFIDIEPEGAIVCTRNRALLGGIW